MKRYRIILLAVVFFCACNNTETQKTDNIKDDDKKEVVVFHAGSLSVPFKQIKEAFEKENPGVNVLLEAAGSRDCARKITDLYRECDVMASADYKVIENLLIPDYTKWYINFASNEMAIVFSEHSKYSNEINNSNWYDILLKEEVIYGRSDPDSDPCGYRAVLCLKLTEKYYGMDNFVNRILEKDRNFIRPKEVDLIALLETKALDYIFLYSSVAEQHGLRYLVLPDSINMKNVVLEDFYQSVSVEISGKKPGEMIEKRGEAMVYGLTIPDNAPNYELALKFVDFILDKEKGMRIIENNGQPSLIPAYSDKFENIPVSLRKYVLKPE